MTWWFSVQARSEIWAGTFSRFISDRYYISARSGNSFVRFQSNLQLTPCHFACSDPETMKIELSEIVMIFQMISLRKLNTTKRRTAINRSRIWIIEPIRENLEKWRNRNSTEGFASRKCADGLALTHLFKKLFSQREMCNRERHSQISLQQMKEC
jgi:hypothetical protein